MNNLIERYVYDVTRRLPEKERGEIGPELEASIGDMLPENPTEADINEVLLKLGAPRALAEKYRQNPRYLISPALFDTYITVLKTVGGIVAIVMASIGIIVNIIQGAAVPAIIGNTISMIFHGLLQVALWVTFGFVIAERSGYKPESWKPGDLPQMPARHAVKIPRTSSIGGMAMSVLITAFIVALIVFDGWFFSMVRIGGVDVSVLSADALSRAVPFIILLGLSGLAANAVYYIREKWDIAACMTNIAHNIIWIAVSAHILSWENLLCGEFAEGLPCAISNIAVIWETVPARQIILGIVAVVAVIDIGSGIVKTWKGRQNQLESREN